MFTLSEILTALDTLEAPAALATLVRVKGSSYRKPGARMLFRGEGPQTGVISAGCLETDVKARTGSVLSADAPQLAVFDLGSDLDLIWGTGMGCQGRAEVLLEPVRPGQDLPWRSACARLIRERRLGVLATVFEARGGAPDAVPGDRFLLEAEGAGTLPPPGPFAEALRREMEETLALETPRNATLASGTGEVEVLLEPILPPFALWIFGAGEHARPLARLAKDLGWFLGLVDHRPALATPQRFPEADRIVVGHPPAIFQDLPLDRRSAALVVSHVYEQDQLALKALLGAPLGYLGLQGNRKRSARILRELQEEGLDLAPDRRALLHAPAGLDLGAESPEAIALSMIAEIQGALAGRPGGSLRDREGPIHLQGSGPLPCPSLPD